MDVILHESRTTVPNPTLLLGLCSCFGWLPRFVVAQMTDASLDTSSTRAILYAQRGIQSVKRSCQSGTGPIRRRTKSHVICCHWHEAGSISHCHHVLVKVKTRRICCVALGAKRISEKATKGAHRASAVETCYEGRLSVHAFEAEEDEFDDGNTVIDFAPLLGTRMVIGELSWGLRAPFGIHGIACAVTCLDGPLPYPASCHGHTGEDSATFKRALTRETNYCYSCLTARCIEEGLAASHCLD